MSHQLRLTRGFLRSAKAASAMTRAAVRNFAPMLLVGGLLATPVAGCSRPPQQVATTRPPVTREIQPRHTENDSAHVRQDAMEHARKSCIATATAKAPKRPGEEARINSYCSCFAERGLSKFSDAELASVGVHEGHFTPEQKSRLTDVAHQCRAEESGSK